MMKRFVIFLLLLVVSCDYFENKKIKTEDIVEKEIQTIDWNVVDVYPSFTVCDSMTEKQTKKHCFETTILNHVNDYLSNQNMIVSRDIEDTISMKLAIDRLGNISILDIKTKPETREVIPEIDSLLMGSFSSLPKIFPAVKRGQQVNTEFVLPVVVSIK